MDKLKILHVITGLGIGGAEAALENLVTHTDEARQRAKVVSLLARNDDIQRLRAAGIDVRTLGMRRGVPGFRGLIRLARIIRKEQPDIIQSWMYHADLSTLLALMLSGRRKKTHLFWGVRCSDMDFSRYGPLLRLVVRLCAWLSWMPTGVIANSEAGLAWHRQLGYRPKMFTVVDNGFDFHKFAPDGAGRLKVRDELGVGEDDFLIGMVARVDPMKDYPMLVSALRRLNGVRCLVIGKNTESLPDAPGLIKLGERSDIPSLLNALDVFVLTSAFGEGFSNSIAEAMATGLPVVATDVGDARRMIADCGAVIAPGDVTALVEAVRRFQRMRSKRKQLGAKSRRRIISEFNVERMTEGFDAIYREVVRVGV